MCWPQDTCTYREPVNEGCACSLELSDQGGSCLAGEHFMPPSQLDAQLADLELDAAPPLPKQPPLEEAAAIGADTQACAQGSLDDTTVCWCH